MAELLTEEQFIDFKRAFTVHASKKDGCIDIKQIVTVARSLGMNPTEEDVEAWDIEFDPDGTKKQKRISFNYFVNLMVRKLREVDPEEDLRSAFRVFDRNGDGYINASELRMIMTNLGEKMTDEEVDEMVSFADTNGDGRINYQEFVAAMTK